MNDVIAPDGCRNRKSGGDHGTKKRGSREGKGRLSNDEGEDAGKNCDKNRGRDACAIVNCRRSYRRRNEKWQRMNSEGEN